MDADRAPLADGAKGDVRSRLRADLVRALKARRHEAIAALRTAIAAIDNAEAVAVEVAGPLPEGVIAGASTGVGSSEAARRVLTDAMVNEILRGEVDGRLTEAADYEARGRQDVAARLRAQAAVLAAYVPR